VVRRDLRRLRVGAVQIRRTVSFDAEWQRCKPYIESALDESWTIDAVEQEIRSGRATLWPMQHSAVVTVVQENPSGRTLLIWLAGGDLNELKQYLPAADNYARAQGCTAVKIEGRAGWEKVLPGYTKRRVILTKELTDE
jgi:hypothetical protein